jgi:thioredoxin-related protein
MKINFLFILYFIIYSSYSQDKIEWIELDNNVEYTNNGKKIIIDLYTDWCGWCKVMDKNTFTDSEVVSIINKNFSPLKFNAEYQGNVNFNDFSFKFIKSGNRGINELAHHLTNGKLSYPMTIFLDENYKIITLLPGYHKPKFYKSVLTYIGDDYWKKMSWSDFTKVNY